MGFILRMAVQAKVMPFLPWVSTRWQKALMAKLDAKR